MTDVPPSTIDVRRSTQRFVTTTDWLVSRHSFSFGQHYDPDNTAFGPLLVCNEDVLAADSGFDTHPHSGVDIVTWVLEGELTHRDSAGHSGTVRPGRVQRLRTGRGIEHSERNEGAGPAHYVQVWVASDEPDAEPDYAQRDVVAELAGGGLVAVASGLDRHRDSTPLRLTSRTALHAARLSSGRTLELPAAPLLHLLVARGAVTGLAAEPLRAGDAVRCRATSGICIEAAEDAEILVWEMHGPLR